jgi:hypothetical protein
MAGYGRSPSPPRGDPNTKALRLSLTAEEWRKLRVLAAQTDTSVALVVMRIVRRELERLPRRT